MLRAVWGTFEACFKSATLPIMNVGAANLMTCQSGKFHGITASTGPIGWYLMYEPFFADVPAMGSSASMAAPCSA
jgi:hypothetical protein